MRKRQKNKAFRIQWLCYIVGDDLLLFLLKGRSASQYKVILWSIIWERPLSGGQCCILGVTDGLNGHKIALDCAVAFTVTTVSPNLKPVVDLDHHNQNTKGGNFFLKSSFIPSVDFQGLEESMPRCTECAHAVAQYLETQCWCLILTLQGIVSDI